MDPNDETETPKPSNASPQERHSLWRQVVPKAKIIVLSLLLLALLATMLFAMNLLTDNVLTVPAERTAEIKPIPADIAFERGVMLTALAGVISSLLSFIGMIVKGIIDDMKTESGSNNETE